MQLVVVVEQEAAVLCFKMNAATNTVRVLMIAFILERGSDHGQAKYHQAKNGDEEIFTCSDKDRFS